MTAFDHRWLWIPLIISLTGCLVPRLPEAEDSRDPAPSTAPVTAPPEAQTVPAPVGGAGGPLAHAPAIPTVDGPAPAQAPVPGPLPDLRLEVTEPARSFSIRHATFNAQSCEVLDGCTTATGARSLMSLEFSLRNDGPAALEIGSRWTADVFQTSRCDQAYIPKMFAAELRDDTGRVVSSGMMATTCIATESGSYTCSAQGLGAHEASAQPQGACDFVDVTDLAAGTYTVTITVNPEHLILESNFDNNTLSWQVEIDPGEALGCEHIACGTTCCPVGASCDNGVCALPDLRVSYEAAADPRKLQVVERSFGVDSCEIEEACVTGTGTRRLLLFEGRLENWGPGDLDLGPQDGNPLFAYSECHGHYHTENFAEYLLRNTDGSIAASGHKQGYCLSDMSRLDDPTTPHASRPPPGRTTPCNRLSAGYADVYDTETACQWIDVTDVPHGDYLLEVTINPDHHIAEADTSNNTIQVPVTLSANGVR